VKNTISSLSLFIASLAVAIVCLLPSYSFGQKLHQGQWKTYTAMSGITDLAVERKSGNVWAATSGGAFRFSPSQNPKSNILALRNTDGLSDNDLTAVAADSNGHIFFGGSSGTINVYSDSSGTVTSITSIFLSTAFIQKRINSIAAFGSTIYFATGFGLSIYNESQNIFDETITKFGSLNDQDTVFAVTESKDSIYIALSSAIAIAPKNAQNLRDPKLWRLVNAPTGTNWRSVVSIPSGRVFAGGTTGVYEITGSSTPNFIPMGDTVSVVRLSMYGNTLFVIDSRENKLLRSVDLSNFTSSALPNANGEKNIAAFAPGNGGSEVFGFGVNGADLLPASGSLVPNIFPEGPLGNNANDLEFSPSSGQLIVSLGSLNPTSSSIVGVSVFTVHDSSWQNFSPGQSILPDQNFISSYYDTVRSKLWLSTYGGGLYSLSTPKLDKLESYNYSVNGVPSLNGNQDGYTVMGKGSLDNSGNFIITTWTFSGEGLLKLGKQSETFSQIQLNPPTNTISYGVSVQDMEGYYFVGTVDHPSPAPYGLISVTSDGKTTTPIPGDGTHLASPSVNALIVDQDNGLWCGTNTGVDVLTYYTDFRGKQTFNKPRRLTFTDQQIIRSIVVDGTGNKWVGTANGVFILSADGSDSLAHYTTANSPLIDDNVLSIAIDIKSGEAYIGTSKGISRVSSIYQEGRTDYGGMLVYPNPVIQHSDDNINVSITGLVGGSTVKIFAAGGKLVKTIDGSALGSTVVWNGLDENNHLLSSGVYIAAAASPVSTSYGQTKFVFIRK
jgi:hypothetical protein